MNYKPVSKPVKRGVLRKLLGKKAYTFKRYIHWYFSGEKIAKNKSHKLLDFSIIQHSSILLRKLKNIDMWLQHNKIDNLRIAIKQIDHIIIEPGEIFSFWYLVGKPVKSKGFKLGMVLENGQVKSGYGGGLCQLANLIYWMSLHSPLTVTERWRHSYDIFPDVNRTIPFGCGATISYNYIDLQIKNNTKQSFQFHLWLTEKELCGEIRSNEDSAHKYEIIEMNHRIQQELSGHYSRHNQIIRRIYHKKYNEVIHEEVLTENHAIMMYSPLIEQKN